MNKWIKKTSRRRLRIRTQDEINLETEFTNRMATFVLSTDSGESHPLEVSIMMGGRELVDLFLKELGGEQG